MFIHSSLFCAFYANIIILILGKWKLYSVTSLLWTLHWLPVKSRIEYKLPYLFFIFCLICTNLLRANYFILWTLMSFEVSELLVVPKCKYKRFGERSLSYFGFFLLFGTPFLKLKDWLAGRPFKKKKKLKTYIFKNFLGS